MEMWMTLAKHLQADKSFDVSLKNTGVCYNLPRGWEKSPRKGPDSLKRILCIVEHTHGFFHLGAPEMAPVFPLGFPKQKKGVSLKATPRHL